MNVAKSPGIDRGKENEEARSQRMDSRVSQGIPCPLQGEDARDKTRPIVQANTGCAPPEGGHSRYSARPPTAKTSLGFLTAGRVLHRHTFPALCSLQKLGRLAKSTIGCRLVTS